MADTPRTEAEILALLPVGVADAIVAQTMRDIVVSGAIGTDRGIEVMPTTELTTSKVLAPDGTGGVEWAEPSGILKAVETPATVLTIVSGTIDVTGLHHVLLSGEGGLSDTLDTMTGGVDGQVVLLRTTGFQIITFATSGTTDGFATARGVYQTLDDRGGLLVAVFDTDAFGTGEHLWRIQSFGNLPEALQDAFTPGFGIYLSSGKVLFQDVNTLEYLRVDEYRSNLRNTLNVGYDASSVTIASDKATITRPNSLVFIAGEGAAADDLKSLTFTAGGYSNGDILFLGAASGTVDITIKHNDAGGDAGGRFFTASGLDITLSSLEQLVQFVYRYDADSFNGAWIQVG